MKVYEILSSSGKSKVEQCAIERKSSLIWTTEDEINSSTSASGTSSLVNISSKLIARLIFISKPFLSHESTVSIGYYRKIC